MLRGSVRRASQHLGKCGDQGQHADTAARAPHWLHEVLMRAGRRRTAAASLRFSWEAALLLGEEGARCDRTRDGVIP